MIVVLPGEKSDVNAVLRGFDAKRWSKLRSELAAREGEMEMPRFRIECGFGDRMIDALSGMGMGEAFNNSADFSNLSDTPAYIRQVAHKTYLKVDEMGTEAGAATIVAGAAAGMSPTDSFRMIVDRPFMVAIIDSETGVVVFLGTIMDPRE